MIFAGMSGTAVGDAAGLGSIEIKAMRDHGYDDDFTVGVTMGSAVIGPIIPPSNNMIIYAFLANASVAKLFLGGFVPGVLMGLALMALVHIYSVRRKYPKTPRQSLLAILTVAGQAIPALLTPVILLGGIYSGLVTPTEAAVLACFYAFLLGVWVYRDADWRGIYLALFEAVKVTAATMFIVAMASGFAWVLSRERIPQVIAELMLSMTQNKYLILFLINIILLIAGCFLDAASAMMILVPILLPFQQMLGIDPIHFGIVVVFNITLGNLTPPVGICLFAGASVSGLPLDRVVRATMPFLVPLLIVLLLITYIPILVTFLPNLIG
jgi:tripartite ATP-independent transporter DctM subunit